MQLIACQVYEKRKLGNQTTITDYLIYDNYKIITWQRIKIQDMAAQKLTFLRLRVSYPLPFHGQHHWQHSSYKMSKEM